MIIVIGHTLTILSWDNPVTAFFEKVEKLRHLGRPSRSDFVQFQFGPLLRVLNLTRNNAFSRGVQMNTLLNTPNGTIVKIVSFLLLGQGPVWQKENLDI